jgi:nitronate monooxygenase
MQRFPERFGLKAPIVAAPLGGGPTTPELVAAVCNAGGFGTLAAAYLEPAKIREALSRTASLTKKPFAVNLFTPMPVLNLKAVEIDRARAVLSDIRAELGIPEPELKAPFHPDFSAQFEAVMEGKPSAFTFVFGMLDEMYLRECRARGIYTIGTATTVSEALELEAAGVDAVIAQGAESGGHRGIFSPVAEDPGASTLELTAQTSKKLKIPVIAAGGIMTGAEIAQVLTAGAQAAMLGTAFLLCPEAGTGRAYRAALKKGGTTKLTRAFSGRLARGIENRFMREIPLEATLPFPAQNAFTRDIRMRAATLDKPEFLSLWAGAGLGKIREMPAGRLVETLIEEMKQA